MYFPATHSEHLPPAGPEEPALHACPFTVGETNAGGLEDVDEVEGDAGGGDVDAGVEGEAEEGAGVTGEGGDDEEAGVEETGAASGGGDDEGGGVEKTPSTPVLLEPGKASLVSHLATSLSPAEITPPVFGLWHQGRAPPLAEPVLCVLSQCHQYSLPHLCRSSSPTASCPCSPRRSTLRRVFH